MSTADNTSYNDVPLFDAYTQQFYYVQFWIFLILIIPSIICSLFGIYHFLRDRNLRQALNNHVIILLLLINLLYECTDIICIIHYFRTFETFTATSSFRLFWGYIDWSFSSMQVILYAWVTIERHILVFHDRLVATRNKRLFIHYLPPLIIIVYCIIYYTLIFFAIPCENNFDNLTSPSMYPCAYLNNELNMYETIMHTIIPILIIVLSSFILLLRVLWQKYHVHRQIEWRRYRKMTIQVLSISSIYLIFQFPYMLINILRMCGMSYEFASSFLTSWTFCSYYTLLLFPIITIGSLPDLKKKLKHAVCLHRQQRAIVPTRLDTVNMINNPAANR